MRERHHQDKYVRFGCNEHPPDLVHAKTGQETGPKPDEGTGVMHPPAHGSSATPLLNLQILLSQSECCIHELFFFLSQYILQWTSREREREKKKNLEKSAAT